MEWIYQAPLLFFSVVFHEFSHGYMAYRRGDDTAYLSGRLTFNPAVHVDLFGTILLPVLCYMSHLPMFGWAKPVPVNPLRLNRPRQDMVAVAAMGPLSNIALALAGVLLLKAVLLASSLLGADNVVLAVKALSFLVTVNLVLAVFNLIPIAPLDGFQIARGLLPYKWAVVYERHVPYGMWIVLGLIVTGIMRYIITLPVALSMLLLAKMGLFTF